MLIPWVLHFEQTQYGILGFITEYGTKVVKEDIRLESATTRGYNARAGTCVIKPMKNASKLKSNCVLSHSHTR